MLLQGRGCVCLFRLGTVNPGREPGTRESKAQEAPALPPFFFPDATGAVLRKQRRVRLVRSEPKASAKAQHLLRNQSRFCGLLLLLA